MKQLKVLVYTTTNAVSLKKDVPYLREVIGKVKGLELGAIGFCTIPSPASIPTERHPAGYTLPNRDWFVETFTSAAVVDGYNAVCFHFTPAERDAWGFGLNDSDLGGYYHFDPDDILEFIVASDTRSEWRRVFLHELAHGLFPLSGAHDRTHEFEYAGRGDIAAAYATISFERHNLFYPILVALKGILAQLLAKQSTPMTLHQLAVSTLGKDASPKDLVRDGLGCAESVSTLIRQLDPVFPIVTGTWTLYDTLRASAAFIPVPSLDEARPGDIVLAVTGMGSGAVPNGHVGVVDTDERIMSNTSASGMWERNYTYQSWRDRYEKTGGFPLFVYRRIA